MQQPLDVLIVGAGPTGLTLALDLARRGLSFRVIDQEPTFHTGTRARGLSPRSQEVFEDLGINERLQDFQEPRFPVRFYSETHILMREIKPEQQAQMAQSPDIPYPSMLMISQLRLETLLRERLADYHIAPELKSRLHHFTRDETGVQAHIQCDDREEVISARYLVGCDGASSTVRKQAGMSFQGETKDDTYLFLGSVHVEGLSPDAWYQWFHAQKGMLATLQPLPRDGNWWFLLGLTKEEYQQYPATIETLQTLFNQRIQLEGVRFTRADWLSNWRLNVRMVDHYRKGRVFLAGDAAHIHSPAGGQGMQTGIQDAYNLGWKLAAVLKGAPETLLDSYEAERLPIAHALLHTTTERLRSFQQHGAKSMAQTITGKDPFADITQISLHYRESSLSLNLSEATSVRAGDRAPDATELQDTQGQLFRLFEKLAGPTATLMSFGAGRPDASWLTRYPELRFLEIVRSSTGEHDTSTLIDLAGHAHQIYGVNEQAFLLVRPDGYIGLTGRELDLSAIARYLARIQ